MNALAQARFDLTAAVAAVLGDGYRVYPVRPPQPATPMVWFGAFGMQPDTVGDGAVAVVALTGTAYAILDGDYPAQVAGSDAVQSALWDALDAIATPTGSTVGPLDVGGPQLTGVTATFTMVVGAANLCGFELLTNT